LPAHTTDLLQPLDVSVFKSLKNSWGDLLFTRLHLNRSKLTKAEFCTFLSDDLVWKKALTEEHIQNGFRKCGIWPLNREAYPEHRFNKNLKNRYDVWLGEGKPEMTAEELDDMLDQQVRDETVGTNQPVTHTPIQGNFEYQGKKGKIVQLQFFVPNDEPDNLIPLSQNIQTPSSSTCSTPTFTPNSSIVSETSFKEVLLKKIDEATRKNSTPTNQTKRKKVNPYGAVVTSDEQFELAEKEAKEKEAKEKEKEEKRRLKKLEQAKKKVTKGKKKNKVDKEAFVESEEDESSDNAAKQPKEKKKRKEDKEKETRLDSASEDFEDSAEEETSEEEGNSTRSRSLFPPKDDEDAYKYLQSVWEELYPPVLEDSLIGKFFGVIYYTKKDKPILFIGKVLQRFLFEEDGEVEGVEMECLKKASCDTSTVLEVTPSHLPRDISVFLTHNIIAGPIKASLLKGLKWSVPDYPKVVETFNAVKKLERQKELERFNSLMSNT